MACQRNTTALLACSGGSRLIHSLRATSVTSPAAPSAILLSFDRDTASLRPPSGEKPTVLSQRGERGLRLHPCVACIRYPVRIPQPRQARFWPPYMSGYRLAQAALHSVETLICSQREKRGRWLDPCTAYTSTCYPIRRCWSKTKEGRLGGPGRRVRREGGGARGGGRGTGTVSCI